MPLYRYEVKGIQAFVLRSSKLRDIIAASAMVAKGLNDALDELVTTAGGEILIQAAGSATLHFPDAKAVTAFAEVWPLVVAKLLPGPQVIAAIANNLNELRAGLERARNTPAAPAFDPGPLVARAARSGAPAITQPNNQPLRDAVHERLRSFDHDTSMESLLLTGHLQNKRFTHKATHLQHDGYLALVHADGNSIGKRVAELVRNGDTRAFQRFSENLKEATRTAVQQALVSIFEHHSDATLPFRPVVVGGDDVTVLLQPRHARGFTSAYLDAFETACKQRDLTGYTASAAIVYAKTKAPFYAVHEVCEQLCKHVKTHTNRARSAFAVHRITASPFTPFHDTVAQDLSAPGQLGFFLGGPYAIRDHHASAACLDALIEAANQLPRGGLRGWLQLRQQDKDRAQVRWDRLAEVHRSTQQHRAAWDAFSAHLAQGCWSTDPARSPLLDVLNLTHLEGAS